MNRDTMTNTGLLLMRLMLGIVFIYHGQGKLFGGLEGFAGYLSSLGVPLPQFSALLAALSEVGGGLLLLSGLGFRYALWPLVFTMLVASFAAHPGQFNIQNGGMEYALTLAVMVAGLALVGPGDFTVRKLIPNRTQAQLQEA
jgi:putative oxidoreductase